MIIIIILLGIMCFLAKISIKENFNGYSSESYDTQDESLQNITNLIRKNYIFTAGMIVMWNGTTDKIPSGWALCNGQNGTPDLRDRFIVSSGTNYKINQTGGNDSIKLIVDNIPSHTHNYFDSVFSENWGSFSKKKNASRFKPDYSTGYDNPGSGDTDNDNNIIGKDRNTNATGGNKPFDNRPKYYALAFIMKLAN